MSLVLDVQKSPLARASSAAEGEKVTGTQRQNKIKYKKAQRDGWMEGPEEKKKTRSGAHGDKGIHFGDIRRGNCVS